MPSWKEYAPCNQTVADWLPWGGITHPHVVQNKDGSFFSIISYEPFEDKELHESLPEFKNGWSLWVEQQHFPGQADRYCLVVCWNPFLSSAGRIKNMLHKKRLTEGEAKWEFANTAQEIQAALSATTPCHLLEYQEILDFMSFAISMGEEQAVMPETPLYLDALLSQDLDIDLSGNHIAIGGKEILVFSLPGQAQQKELDVINGSLDKLPFRYVQRLLLFGEKQAERNLHSYMSKWCGGRKSVKRLLMADLLGKLNGIYSNNFFLLVDSGKVPQTIGYVQEMLDIMELPYIMEEYNRKDIWWGSLPGLFRANTILPQAGFRDFSELAAHPRGEKEGLHV